MISSHNLCEENLYEISFTEVFTHRNRHIVIFHFTVCVSVIKIGNPKLELHEWNPNLDQLLLRNRYKHLVRLEVL